MSEQYVRVGFGVMILKENRVLLGKRHDAAEKASSEMHGEGTWTMPGGKLHFQKTFEGGAVREVKEETGIEIKESDLELISVTNNRVPDAHFLTLGFLINECDQEPRVMEPDEITEWRWFELDNLPTKVFPPSLEVIDHYNSKVIYG